MGSKCSKERYKALLDELCDGDDQYSFPRWYLELRHPDPRDLMQLKCIEKFKWERSEIAGHEITGHEAGMAWVQEGYAEVFSEVFDVDLCCEKIYLQVKELVQEL